MVWSPDGRYLLITNNGWAKPSITVFDTTNFFIQSTLPIDHAWLGLAWHPDGKRLYSSGAAQNVVNELAWSDATLKAGEPIVIGKPVLRPTFETLKDSGFVGGVAVSPDGNHLYAVQVFGSAVSMIDPVQRKVERTAHLSAEPYSTLVSADGKSLFVSLWGGAKLLVLDAATLELKADVRVGEHPERDGPVERRLAPVRRLRQHQCGLGRRPRDEPRDRADWRRALPEGAARDHARTRWRSRPTARRCWSPTPTTTPWRWSTSPPRAQAGCAASFPTGWYPTGVTFSKDGRRHLRPQRQGAVAVRQPARPAAGPARRERAVHRDDAPGRALRDRAARRRGAGGDDEAGL